MPNHNRRRLISSDLKSVLQINKKQLISENKQLARGLGGWVMATTSLSDNRQVEAFQGYILRQLFLTES
jgi:hypothetical protein